MPRTTAAERLLAKLPCSADDLTRPERAQLRRLEREGRIVYRADRWHAAPRNGFPNDDEPRALGPDHDTRDREGR